METGKQTSKAAGKSAAKKAAIAVAVFVALAAALIAAGDASYLWLKAFHVIAIISWMAGMVYLPRLFVYHADAEAGSVQSETFKVMERRLLKVIMTPAMLISWILGLWLAWAGGHLLEVWFLLKMLGVVGLSAAHMFFAKSVRLFAADANDRTPRQWRMLNEIPTVLMIVIVFLVIVKPF